jgi:hypothetical protein
MKRFVFVAVGMMVGMWPLATVVGAAESPEGGKAAMQEPVVPPALPSAADKTKQEAAAKLNRTEWTVEFSLMSAEKLKKPMHDTLQFDQGKLTSAMLTKDGYTPSNYTLSVGADGVPIWETMQNSEKGTASWRGELHGETMSGILSRHGSDGTAQDYSFLGRQSGTVASTSAPATPVAAVQSSAPAKSEKPKKKKGWF